MISRPMTLSRLPVGSSASSSPGRLINAPCHGDALLLTARQLRGQGVGPVVQADRFEQFHARSRR